MKKVLLLLLLLTFVFWFPHNFKRWTHPFHISKCDIDWPYDPRWEIEEEPEAAIVDLFHKPFSYLSKGKQSFVFLSADGEYVLKLFRFDSYRQGIGAKILKQIQKWMGWPVPENRKSLPVRAEMTFNSCYLCYSRARPLTEVVWVHLNPKQGKIPPFFVLNRLGKKFRVDPGKYRFVVQKKAKALTKTLLELPSKHERKKIIDSYCDLLVELKSLGFSNDDPKMGENFGVIDGKVIAIDVGNFNPDHSFTAAEVSHFKERLYSWMEKKFPGEAEEL